MYLQSYLSSCNHPSSSTQINPKLWSGWTYYKSCSTSMLLHMPFSGPQTPVSTSFFRLHQCLQVSFFWYLKIQLKCQLQSLLTRLPLQAELVSLSFVLLEYLFLNVSRHLPCFIRNMCLLDCLGIRLWFLWGQEPCLLFLFPQNLEHYSFLINVYWPNEQKNACPGLKRADPSSRISSFPPSSLFSLCSWFSCFERCISGLWYLLAALQERVTITL